MKEQHKNENEFTVVTIVHNMKTIVQTWLWNNVSQ